MNISTRKRAVLFACSAMMAGLLVSGCSDDKQAAQAEMPAPLVQAITLEKRNVPLVGEFVGLTAGSLAVQVRAQVGGILKKRNFTEGDLVKQGQILFEIDPDTYQAALAQAKGKLAQTAAAVDQARREWDRIQSLYAKNAVSQKDRDTAQTAFTAAKADYEAAHATVTEAEIKLSYAYVVAPISGYTTKESWTEGNLISTVGEASSLLTSINQLDPIFVDFSIPSTEYLRLRRLVSEGKAVSVENAPAHIRFSDGSDYAHAGRVTFLDTRVDINTSVIKARAVFPNPKRVVLPGQFVRVSVGGIELKDALLIPQSAMLQTQKGAIVMVLNDKNEPEVRPIKIGDGLQDYSIGNAFVVEEGLSPGERVISEGINKIRPGQSVRIEAATGTPAADKK